LLIILYHIEWLQGEVFSVGVYLRVYIMPLFMLYICFETSWLMNIGLFMLTSASMIYALLKCHYRSQLISTIICSFPYL